MGVFRLLEKFLGFPNHTWYVVVTNKPYKGMEWVVVVYFTKRDPLASVKHVIKLAWPYATTTSYN